MTVPPVPCNPAAAVPDSRSRAVIASMRRLMTCCMAAIVLATPAAADAQLTVDALEIFMNTSTANDVRLIGVRNDATSAVQATVTIGDWDRDEQGTNRFLPAGSHARSCSTALQVFPTSLVLEPGESANVRVSLDATGNPALRNCWSIVFLENRATQETAGRQLTYNVRTGVKIYGEHAQVRRDGFVEDMTVVATDGDSAKAPSGESATGVSRNSARERLTIAFRNAGDVQLKVKGNVEVRRADNSVLQRIPVTEFPVLPEQLRLLGIDLPVLPAGRYVLLALLDYGGSELVAGQLEYEVP